MTKIQVKRSSVANAVPTMLSPGEIAVNTADRKLFIGDVNNVNAVWQRRKPKPAKKKRAKRSPNGTRRPKPKQRPPKLLVRFGDALPVTPVLGYMDRSKAMAEALMPAALSRAIADAIRTAK